MTALKEPPKLTDAEIAEQGERLAAVLDELFTGRVGNVVAYAIVRIVNNDLCLLAEVSNMQTRLHMVQQREEREFWEKYGPPQGNA